MRRWLTYLVLPCWLSLLSTTAEATTGRVIKVLPHLMDLQGRHTVYPSLYERDSYQALLRENPEKRSGIRFDVQWKAKSPVVGTLRLIIEMRGIAESNVPQQLVLEEKVKPRWSSQWTSFVVRGERYRYVGEVTAWRVSLWDDDDLLSEQTSFLW